MPKLVIFGINLPKKGIPLKRFYNIWLKEGSPRSAPSSQILLFWLLKCGHTVPKMAKSRNFWYKFTPMGKFWGSTEKVGYRCTTTNLPLCNDTMIVLKITPLHSVSVITNFVIPKRDKKTNKKPRTFSSTAGARPTITTILGMMIELVRPVFAPS